MKRISLFISSVATAAQGLNLHNKHFMNANTNSTMKTGVVSVKMQKQKVRMTKRVRVLKKTAKSLIQNAHEFDSKYEYENKIVHKTAYYGEIGVGERGTAQVCPDQSGATEIGTLEVGAPQIRPLKISIP